MPNRVISLPADDPRLSHYRDLPQRNLTACSGRFIAEGKWLVERLAASDYEVESVVVDERRLELLPTCLDAATPVYALPAGGVEELVGFHFHRGILACGLRRPFLSPTELVPSGGPALLIACADIHDPSNLGGILRNCAAFGVDGVLLSRNCADPFSRRVLRVSMGTAFRLRMAVMQDPLIELPQLRSARGCQLVASVLSATAEHLTTSTRPQRLVLLIGNEGHGVPQSWLDGCDRQITVPMAAGVDSLNAAAASAVFLYHFTRCAFVK